MTIENTSNRDALTHLVGAWGDPSRYIHEQEAAGQRQIVGSQMLPAELNRGTQAEFEALGFVFGAIDSADALFRQMTLPDGWRKEGSDHDMWSYVLDENGNRRVSVFYKASFYDRRAFMSLTAVESGQ